MNMENAKASVQEKFEENETNNSTLLDNTHVHVSKAYESMLERPLKQHRRCRPARERFSEKVIS